MSDDRGDYYNEVLHQLSNIIANGGSRDRIKQHLERHGYDCSELTTSIYTESKRKK